MKNILVAILAAALLLAVWTHGAAAPAPQPAATGDEASLDQRYAALQVQYAEAVLRTAERRNQLSAGSVSKDTITKYQEALAVAKLQLANVLHGAQPDGFAIWLRRAEAIAKLADVEWHNASAANDHVSGSVNPLDLERLRLRAELARVDAERGRHIAGQSLQSQLQWELALVDGELHELREIKEERLPIPYWRVYPWRY